MYLCQLMRPSQPRGRMISSWTYILPGPVLGQEDLFLIYLNFFVSYWDPPLHLLSTCPPNNFSSISSHSRGQYWCCSEEDEISTPVEETASHREGWHSCTKTNMDSAALFSGLGQHISQCFSNLHASNLFVIFMWLIILPDFCLALFEFMID